VKYDSLMISDMTAIVELAARRRGGAADQLKMLPGDPIRFMISTTLADQTALSRANALGIGEGIGVC
jgi:hypothetical protein